jgi:hypothetical protein
MKKSSIGFRVVAAGQAAGQGSGADLKDIAKDTARKAWERSQKRHAGDTPACKIAAVRIDHQANRAATGNMICLWAARLNRTTAAARDAGERVNVEISSRTVMHEWMGFTRPFEWIRVSVTHSMTDNGFASQAEAARLTDMLYLFAMHGGLCHVELVDGRIETTKLPAQGKGFSEQSSLRGDNSRAHVPGRA